jgi:hypothetical protein
VSEGGWEPAGTGQPAPDGDNRASSGRSKVIIAAVAIVALAAGVAGSALWFGLGKGPSPAGPSTTTSVPNVATAAQVQLEPTSSAGASPFMSPVGQDQSNVKAPSNTGGTFSGDTPGLFADTGDKPSCDAQTLIANLAADTTKATAWATALGLQSQDIPTYVTSLTPVVLRSDTAVTSYGYADNRFLAYPAVLQAGTSVFVNSYGEPKAKCFSGNPLTQPVSNQQASYVGTSWQGFAPTSVTYIDRTPTVIVNYIVVDVYKGTTHHYPAKPPKYDDNQYQRVCKPDRGKISCGAVVQRDKEDQKGGDHQRNQPGQENKSGQPGPENQSGQQGQGSQPGQPGQPGQQKDKKDKKDKDPQNQNPQNQNPHNP